MEERGDFRTQVQAIFKDPETHLQLWLRAVEKRAWTLHLDSATSKVSLAELRPSCAKFLVTFSKAILAAPALELGALEFREPIQTLTFMAGWMAGKGATLTDVLGLVHGLNDIMSGPLHLFQAIEVAVGEAFTVAIRQKEYDHYTEVTAKSQLVFALHSQLPCAFLVGEPDRWALEDVIGRLLMLALMHGTPVIVVDVSGVVSPEMIIERLLTLLSRENREVTAHAILSGLPPRLIPQVASALPEGVSLQDDLDQALEEAGRTLGIEWRGSNVQ